MEQRNFADVRGLRRQEKVTRLEKFLEKMERVLPWKWLEARDRVGLPGSRKRAAALCRRRTSSCY